VLKERDIDMAKVPHKILKNSFWIWHEDFINRDNTHLYFRRKFRLDFKPEEAVVHITANTHYKFFINGRYVGNGPSPCDPTWQYYDSYEVRDYLKTGDNLFAVHAYSYGQSPPSGKEGKRLNRLSKGPGGFIFHAEIMNEEGFKKEVFSDSYWKIKEVEAYQDTRNQINHWGVGYKEYFLQEFHLPDWNKVDFVDSDWEKPCILGKPPLSPWVNLIPREIPFLKEEIVYPVDVVSIDNKFGNIKDTKNLITRGRKASVFRADIPGSMPTVILDFKREVVGYPEIEFGNCRGGTIVVSYGESLALKRIDHIVLNNGNFLWSSYERRTFRYLSITVLNTPLPVPIKSVAARNSYYPIGYKKEFAAKDQELKKIWDVCAATQKANMQEHHEDCPVRERALWFIDLKIQNLISYHLYRDYKIAAKCLKQGARIQLSDGSIPAVGPVKNNTLIPGSCAFWIMSIKDYYDYSKDKGLVNELMPNVRKVIDWFHKNTDKDGLIKDCNHQGWWNFIDWAKIGSGNYSTPLQCLYYKSLADAAYLEVILGNIKKKKVLQERADKVKESINKLFYSSKTGLYADALDKGNLKGFSQQTNVLAVLFNICAHNEKKKIIKKILNDKSLTKIKTGYFNYYLGEALFQNDFFEEGIKLIKSYWGAMLRRGAITCWEMFDSESPHCEMPFALDDRSEVSFCHSYAAGALVLIDKYFR